MAVDRVKKVDVNQMSEEQIDVISQSLGEKVNEVLLKSKEDCEKLLSIYGLSLEVSFKISPIDSSL